MCPLILKKSNPRFVTNHSRSIDKTSSEDGKVFTLLDAHI